MGIDAVALRLVLTGVLACSTSPATLGAQEQTGVQAVDSAASLSRLSVRVLTLKVQLQTLRARLSEQPSSVPMQNAEGGRLWADSMAALRSGIVGVRTDVSRLRLLYERERHAEGVRLTTDLDALARTVERTVATLASARDARAARIEISHMSARLDALLERIAAAQKCCRLTLHQ